MKEVGIFVDVNRVYQNKERRLNYQRYLDQAKEGYFLRRAYAYGVQINNEAHFFSIALKNMGWIPKYRQAKVVRQHFYCKNCDYDNFIERPSTMDTSWNAGIALDVANNLDFLSKVVIGSNDTDLIPLIRYVMDKGIQVEIFCNNVPYELTDIVDFHRPIDPSLLDIIPPKTESLH